MPHSPSLLTSGASPSEVRSSGFGLAVVADRIQLGTTVFAALVALVLGVVYDDLGQAVVVAVPLLAVAFAGYAFGAGTGLAQGGLTLALAGLVALHIQLSHGMVEFHFGVFVTLALLLVYRDWRPIVFAAGLFAVHHIAFDRLQAAGFGIYCLHQPDLFVIVVHATYVVVQTVLEVLLARWMRSQAQAGEELSALVRTVSREGHIQLDVGHVSTVTPLGQALRDTFARIQIALAEVEMGTGHIQSVSHEMETANQDLSHRTEEQASALQQTAASIEELTSAVRQNAENARQASQLATGTDQAVGELSQAAAGVGSVMGEISQASHKIGDIIGVIDSIAFQTNILALNAAVEAARAGEQGRGFAVVASEVRALAGRSAVAAKDIKALIEDSVAKAAQGDLRVAEAASKVEAIAQSTKRVASILGEISVASTEQSQGIEQVNQAIGQMDQVTQQNAALVEEAAAATGALKSQAAQLAQAVGVFRLSDAALRDVSRPAPVKAAHPRPSPSVRPAPSVRSAVNPPKNNATPLLAATRAGAADDWETF